MTPPIDFGIGGYLIALALPLAGIWITWSIRRMNRDLDKKTPSTEDARGFFTYDEHGRRVTE